MATSTLVTGFHYIDEELGKIFTQCPPLRQDTDFITSLKAIIHLYPLACSSKLFEVDDLPTMKRNALYVCNSEQFKTIHAHFRRYALRSRHRIGFSPTEEQLRAYDLGLHFLVRVMHSQVEHYRLHTKQTVHGARDQEPSP